MPSSLLGSAVHLDPRGADVADVATRGRDRTDASGATTPPAGATYRALRAARDQRGAMRLIDAMRALEPTWIEGVAVVQAVCAQLGPNEIPPAVGDIVLSDTGAVSFPLSGIAGADVAIQAVARLLTGFLRAGGCPLPVWEATERAQRAPMSFGSVSGFGAALTQFPAQRGPEQLAAFVQQARALALRAPHPTPPPRPLPPWPCRARR